MHKLAPKSMDVTVVGFSIHLLMYADAFPAIFWLSSFLVVLCAVMMSFVEACCPSWHSWPEVVSQKKVMSLNLNWIVCLVDG